MKIESEYENKNEGEELYFSQIDGSHEIEVYATDMFSAIDKTMALYKKIWSKEEKPGQSISFRIWQAYGEGF